MSASEALQRLPAKRTGSPALLVAAGALCLVVVAAVFYSDPATPQQRQPLQVVTTAGPPASTGAQSAQANPWVPVAQGQSVFGLPQAMTPVVLPTPPAAPPPGPRLSFDSPGPAHAFAPPAPPVASAASPQSPWPSPVPAATGLGVGSLSPQAVPAAPRASTATATLPGNEPQGTGGTAAPPAAVSAPPLGKALPFQEAHWQGLELIPLTPALGKSLKIPSAAKGVIVDDVTTPADLVGFMAGDLVTAVGQRPTPTLEKFVAAADRVRRRQRVELDLIRKGKEINLVLPALQARLGNANGETAPMIQPGAQPPHRYQGPCTNCHRIGTTGQLAFDQGDTLQKVAPPIRATQAAPHRQRGACVDCHQVTP